MIFRRSQLFQASATGILHRRLESISQKSGTFPSLPRQERGIVQKLPSGEGPNFLKKIPQN